MYLGVGGVHLAECVYVPTFFDCFRSHSDRLSLLNCMFMLSSTSARVRGLYFVTQRLWCLSTSVCICVFVCVLTQTIPKGYTRGGGGRLCMCMCACKVVYVTQTL